MSACPVPRGLSWAGAGKQHGPVSALLFPVIQKLTRTRQWIPAFAGMTIVGASVHSIVIPAKAGIHCPCQNRPLAQSAALRFGFQCGTLPVAGGADIPTKTVGINAAPAVAINTTREVSR
jgi:hypothetical protein